MHGNVFVYSMIKHNHSPLWRESPFGVISGIVTCMFDKLESGRKWENKGEKKNADTDINVSSLLFYTL